MVVNDAKEKGIHFRPCDERVMRVGPEYIRIPMKMSQVIRERCSKELSELKHCNNAGVREWKRQSEKCTEWNS